jgi:hypothetical protein
MIEPNGRPNGVMVSPGQLSPGQGTPRTLNRFVEAQTFAVEYVDDGGAVHITLAVRIGGVWHLPPNGENYAATLRPLKADTWLSKDLESQFADRAPATVPAEDAVDVVDAGG